MKKSLVALSVLALSVSSHGYAAPITSASDPALAGAMVLDFEAGPVGTFQSQSFGGLTISALNGSSFSVGSDYAGSYNTRGNYHITNYGNQFQGLRFDFAGPVSAFGGLFGASDASWTLNAFNAGGTLLDSMTIAPVGGSNNGDFFGLKGLANASYATFVQNFDGAYAGGGVDYVFLDNLAGVAAVPEPETYGMMLAGLGLLGFVARRRKSVAA